EARQYLRAEARQYLRAEARQYLRAEARQYLRAEARQYLRAEARQHLRVVARPRSSLASPARSRSLSSSPRLWAVWVCSAISRSHQPPAKERAMPACTAVGPPKTPVILPRPPAMFTRMQSCPRPTLSIPAI